MRPDYEFSVCQKGYYGMINGMKVIVCLKDNQPCPFQRYCPTSLTGVHVSGVLTCSNKN